MKCGDHAWCWSGIDLDGATIENDSQMQIQNNL